MRFAEYDRFFIVLKVLCNEEEDDEQRHGKRRKLQKSFRINAKVTGRFKKLVNSKEVSSCVGSALIKNHLGKCGWNIDLRRPTLEISFYFTDEGMLCGAPLTRTPLSERYKACEKKWR